MDPVCNMPRSLTGSSLHRKRNIAGKFDEVGAPFYDAEAVKKHQGLESFRLSVS